MHTQPRAEIKDVIKENKHMTKWFATNLKHLSSNESYMFLLSKDDAYLTVFLTTGEAEQ